MTSALSLSLLIVLAFTVSTSEANYEFTIHFYEFRNPLGLQCGECESHGPPACCDDVQRTENCTNVAPLTCDTRFRFLLRPFETQEMPALTMKFSHFTPSNGGNSDAFNVGRGGFLSLPNPFIISSTMKWTGRIQFFIDALDRNAQSGEMIVFINRFPIDLELELGADFTERTTYTGIYNISGLGFDMSFRVQCSENYYGPNCNTFCEPMEGVYTCDSEGILICLQGNQSFCTQCLSSWNPSPSCATCLDPSMNCTTCHNRNLDPSTNCTECVRYGASNCITCLPDFMQVGSNCSRRVESTEEMISMETIDLIDGGLNLALVGGVAGGGLAALVVIIIFILCILVVVIQKRKRTKYDISDAASCLSVADSSTYTKKTASGRSNTPQYDFKNPIYGPASTAPDTTGTTNGDQYPLEQLLEVPNPFYGEFTDSASQVGSKRGSQTSLNEDVATPRPRVDTFPYVMDGAENATSNASTPYHQQRERVKHVVYEMADIASGKPTRAEDGLYDTADNVCGKPVIAENGMYDTADKVCGKPVRAEDGKKGVALQGEEYDEIKTSGATAAVYDDIVSGKKLTDVKMSDNTSATVYDDILTNNTSALYDDVKVAETAPLYDEVVKTSKPPSVPTATGIDEYDDIIKGPEKASSGAAAKPSNTNAFTYTGKGEQPFDNEVYNAPYPPPDSQPPVANFANNSTYVN